MDVCVDVNVMMLMMGMVMLIRLDIERVKKVSAGDRTASDISEQIGEEEVYEELFDQLLNFFFIFELCLLCIVKLYGEMDDLLKLNDVVEFVGMLYYALEFGVEKWDQQMEDSLNVVLYVLLVFFEEDVFKNLVMSLVFRFYVLAYKVTFQNKFVNSTSVERFSEIEMEILYKFLLEQVNLVCFKLLDIFINVFGGDVFVVELVLMMLISRVYTRTDMFILGKFFVNFIGCKLDLCEMGMIFEMLFIVIGQVCLSIVYFFVIVFVFNVCLWLLKKDYVYNRFRFGSL